MVGGVRKNNLCTPARFAIWKELFVCAKFRLQIDKLSMRKAVTEVGKVGDGVSEIEQCTV